MMDTPPLHAGNQNARTHGLTSRTPVRGCEAEIRRIAEALLAGTTAPPHLAAAADEIARLTVLQGAITVEIAAETNRLIKESSPDGQFNRWFDSLPTPAALARGLSRKPEGPGSGFEAFLPTVADMEPWLSRSAAFRRLPEVERHHRVMKDVFGKTHKKLEALRTYDRKCRSRLAKAIQRFDYLRLEVYPSTSGHHARPAS